jgi:LmbE family N-acetylglucosaminyl deacetylase
VSPHLDDAVLSAGGYLAARAARGDEVVVYTVFAGLAAPPYSATALRVHEQWGLADDPVGHRRAEDRAAVAALGALAVHGPFLDVMYRHDPAGGWLIDSRDRLTGSTVDEAALGREAVAAIAALLRDRPPDRLLTCAAVGGHVDHRRTRDAVLAAGTAAWLWEDVPYAAAGLSAPPLPPGTVSGPALARPVDPAAWAAKCAAVRRYPSQHSMVFPGSGDYRVTLRAQAVRRAADLGHDGPVEVFWPVRPAR